MKEKWNRKEGKRKEKKKKILKKGKGKKTKESWKERKKEKESNAHLQRLFYKCAFGGTTSPSKMSLEKQICFEFSLPFLHYCCSDATFMIVSAMQCFNGFSYLAKWKKTWGWEHKQVSVHVTLVGLCCFSVKYQILNRWVFWKHHSVFLQWTWKFARKAVDHGTRSKERFWGWPELKS